MFRYRTLIPFLLCAGLAACTAIPNYFNAYKIDIQQGNVLTQEMVAQLKPGQSRDQVRFILGTPLIADMFHQQRWDYVYRYYDGQTGSVEQRRFSVFFDKNNLLERVAGDVEVATAADLTAPANRTRLVDLGSLEAAGVPLPVPEESSYFSRLRDWVGF
jgi:outer membrane protein assembly factor BamE